MVHFATLSDAGRRAGANEDAVGALAEEQLWFVADGVGGNVAGAVASGIVKKTLEEEGAALGLDAAVQRAHAAILAHAGEHPECAGMGSTVVAAQLFGARCHIVWVGDSRAYLWRRRALRLLTRDHSFVEALREQLDLSETEAHEHPQRNLVLQTLGFETPVPSVLDERLRGGDRLLLCSDGLNDELTDARIAAVLAGAATPEEAARALITAALAAGGRDNVSVVVVDYGAAGPFDWLRPGPQALALLAILGGVAAALVALAAAWWLLMRRH